MEETVHVPFGGSDERPCNKKVRNANPGPGTYIDINNPMNSSICKSLNKIKEDRSLAESQGVKLGAFGTTSRRFEKGWLAPKDGPAPGQYEDGLKNILSVYGTDTTASTQGFVETTEKAEKKKPN